MIGTHSTGTIADAWQEDRDDARCGASGEARDEARRGERPAFGGLYGLAGLRRTACPMRRIDPRVAPGRTSPFSAIEWVPITAGWYKRHFSPASGEFPQKHTRSVPMIMLHLAGFPVRARRRRLVRALIILRRFPLAPSAC